MVKNVEHIGIAVANVDKANVLFEALLGQASYKEEEVETEGVRTSFFIENHTKIELLGATNRESPIAKFVERKGAGIHHIAFAVDDIYAEMERLQVAGFELLNDKPKKGADNKLICFVHPKSAGGVLVELCQERKEE
ncbi:MAG: methylmalonyl-CoA epimerase [Bacteroidetes bacterium]|jgi:methylmalonyl-CoA/ethylmalonyl-CoA epimerase|nr:methylmalonyl-CoA epimerase [Bacteroidota bacterium]